MDTRKIVWKETAVIAVGELIGSAIMLGVLAALDRFDMRAVWSALAGSAIMVVNYFFMAVVVMLSSDRAQNGEVEQAKKMVQTSSLVRLLCMGLALFVCIRLGADVIALVLPLAFVRPILLLAEFFGKKGDQ